MSKAVANLLGKTEKEVAKAILTLEKLCGQPSEDIRLVNASRQKIKNKTSQLGLDPNDTTGPELYHALLAK